MIWKIILTIAATGLAGYLYHLGGKGLAGGVKTPRQVSRCLGNSLIDIAVVLMWTGYRWNGFKDWTSYWPAICFLFSFIALTTYWSKKKGQDATAFNWGMTGFVEGLVYLPYVLATHRWIGFVIRTLVVAAGTAAWSVNTDKPADEEGGRGGIKTILLPLLKF
jgi:hypothetical protein